MRGLRHCSVGASALLLGLALLVGGASASDGVESGRQKQYYGGSASVSAAGSITYRLIISTTARAEPPTRGMIRTAATRQGIDVVRVGKVRGYTRKYVTFSARNARRNLSMRTGATLVESDAHHVMPRFREGYFKSKGINIHHPKHMLWWYRPSHQHFAARYNGQWERWIDGHRGASKKQVLREAKRMRAAYADYDARPGPAGWQPDRCRGSVKDRRR